MALTPSIPKALKFNSTGGTAAPSAVAPSAPSGRSAAGQMLQNKRAAARNSVPHAPASHRPAPVTKVPAYNALESPYKTQGQFNQGVAQTAKAEYQPELDQFSKEESGEKGLHESREGENASIYAKYHEEAQNAFNNAKSALADIASRQNSSTQAGQQALQAALSNTGISGLQGNPNPNNFMAEAAGFGNQSSQTLGGTQAGEIAEREGGLNVPQSWDAEALNTERQRDQSELAKIGEGRGKILANIPNVEAKVRGELSKNEQERQTNRLQSQIAGSKLGLEKQESGNKNKNEQAALALKGRENRENNALKTEELATQSGFKAEELKVEREKIAAEGQQAKTKEGKEKAELEGKRFDHGLELMSSYLKRNEKTEYNPSGNPQQDQTLAEGGKKQPYQRNAQQLYNILTKQGNLTAPEAFRLMKSSGNGYVEKFAQEHEAIYNSPTKGKTIKQLEKEHPLTPLRKAKLPSTKAREHGKNANALDRAG